MMFKTAIIALVTVATIAAGLYWQNARLSDQLDAAEIRAENAIADLSLTRAALEAQAAHTARVEALVRELSAIEEEINGMDGKDAPVDPDTLKFLRRLGLLAD